MTYGASMDSQDAGYTIDPWDVHGQTRLTAVGADLTTTLAAALAGLFVAAGDDRPLHTDADVTAAAVLRAEGADIPSLFTGLAEALLDELSQASFVVTAVRLDGLLRTEEGLLAWGYALGGRGMPNAVHALTVERVDVVETPSGGVTIRATLVRGAPAT